MHKKMLACLTGVYSAAGGTQEAAGTTKYRMEVLIMKEPDRLASIAPGACLPARESAGILERQASYLGQGAP